MFKNPPGDTSDDLYRWLYENRDHRLDAERTHVEELWKNFRALADGEFLDQIRLHFQERYWEMHFAVSMIQLGYSVHTNRCGPDFIVNSRFGRFLVELTCPGGGSGEDRVTEPDEDVFIIPQEGMVLRITQSLDKKKSEQYEKHLAKLPQDKELPFVIGINLRNIPNSWITHDPPLIIQAVFPIGPPQVTFNADGSHTFGYQFRTQIAKRSGSPVNTGFFNNLENRHVSAVFSSISNACNPQIPLGSDYIVVHNPNARYKLPPECFSRSTQYCAIVDGDVYRVDKITVT